MNLAINNLFPQKPGEYPLGQMNRISLEFGTKRSVQIDGEILIMPANSKLSILHFDQIPFHIGNFFLFCFEVCFVN